ncbi:MAG TPA: winged helix-turn-helix domain-containing protein [Pyrinomonadaceae bacterium]|nr:winged helix-turn-helix domain-containing protein [Pyrinomonadaceae bacterium]
MNRFIESDDHIYQFGPFCLDAGERVLLRDGRLVPLAPKALSTLLVLVRNMGHVLEKNFLIDEVWPDEVVEEGNLAQQIFILRKALGESPNYIETVPRRGYRFLQPASGVNSPSRGFTENAETYQAYLKARYCWSKHTRHGVTQAIAYFCQAIDLDPDYALAYAGVVDCYLRLATNYFPPTDALTKRAAAMATQETDEMLPETRASLETRCGWDREIAKREHRHAAELKLNYPAVHQWRAAYLFARSLYNLNSIKTDSTFDPVTGVPQGLASDLKLPGRFQSSLTPAEEVQVFCVIAREQIDAGNYDAACAVLKRWWTMGDWPNLDGLNPRVSADLLLTIGRLAGFMSSVRQVPRGQKHAEALLNGAIGLFEQLGLRTLSAEGRIELALCYEREGIFDLARTTFPPALEALLSEDGEIRRHALIRLAKVECQAGRLQVALELLKEANNFEEPNALHSGEYHLILAATLHTLTTPETPSEGLDQALQHYLKAMDQWEAIGNHRYAALGENNHGYLLLTLGRLVEAETHLVRARKLFDALHDKRRCAQVDDSLAQLHLAAGRLELAEQLAGQAVKTLETGGLEACLAESLTTQGLVLCKIGRHREARRVLERAYQIAERCGDGESACIALLTVIEKMGAHLGEEEKLELVAQLDRLMPGSQKASTLERIKKCRELIATTPSSIESRAERRMHA